MKHLHKIAFASGAVLLATAAAFAQDAAFTDAAKPAGAGPKPTTNAAMAALYNGAYTPGETMPDPKRPAGGNTNTPHPITNFVPITDAMMRNPSPSDWIMMRGNYQDWGYSKLDQINKTNIKGLTLVWSRLMDPGVNENTPEVYNGVMYLGNPNDVIQAIDAATGEVLWQYRRRLPTQEQMHNNRWGQFKRSLSLYDNKVYTITRDNFLIALDASTGKELWQVKRPGGYYVVSTSGPTVIGGIVISGAQCQDSPFTCYVDAHDAETGKELWHNELIPRPGQPGDETWKGKPYNERWATDVWGPITYDPDANIVTYGSSGTTPASEAQRGMIGATMAGTDTRWAVNPQTGKILWRHQVLPEDNWDQDCTFEMLPIVTPVHPDPKASGMFSVNPKAASASRRTLTGMPCKTGIMWSFDELTGEYLWSKSTVMQTLVDKIDTKGQVTINPAMPIRDVNEVRHFCPTWGGGRDWWHTAYSPQTNTMYIPMLALCSDLKIHTDDIPSPPSASYNMTSTLVMPPGQTYIGRIDAINVETGRTLWSWENPTGNTSPILATASGLLFNGALDRYLRAFDQTDGKVLWKTRLGSNVNGGAVTYSVKGRQYIAVTAGGGSNGGTVAMAPGIDQPSGGNMVYVFALPE